MKLDAIQVLHVELSSKCNAWCPKCARNKNGYELADGVVPENLMLDVLSNALSKLPSLTRVDLCGRYGDPVMHSEFMQVIDWLLARNVFIRIHTNGGMRNVEWWSELGKKLSGTPHKIWFGIDGLKGTHELYRQGTDWNKVMENATAFIQAGGQAVWQLIPFAHNEHQIRECIQLAKTTGFVEFEIIEGVRNPMIAKNYRTGVEYKLEPWSKNKDTNFFEKKAVSKLTVDNCSHLLVKELYITASGKYTLCCHFDSEIPGEPPVLFDTIEETVPLDIESEILSTPRNLCVKACAGLRMNRKLLKLN